MYHFHLISPSVFLLRKSATIIIPVCKNKALLNAPVIIFFHKNFLLSDKKKGNTIFPLIFFYFKIPSKLNAIPITTVINTSTYVVTPFFLIR